MHDIHRLFLCGAGGSLIMRMSALGAGGGTLSPP
jgi:hypothetical protein